jgi:hypothetical protein
VTVVVASGLHVRDWRERQLYGVSRLIVEGATVRALEGASGGWKVRLDFNEAVRESDSSDADLRNSGLIPLNT